MSVIDVRAGLLTPTLRALRDVGFLESVKKGEFSLVIFHILGASVASLDEIEATSAFTGDASHFLVKNFINNTTLSCRSSLARFSAVSPWPASSY